MEMLLVNGTVDFSTPPTALDEARPYFHKAQMVLLPEFSHIDRCDEDAATGGLRAIDHQLLRYRRGGRLPSMCTSRCPSNRA